MGFDDAPGDRQPQPRPGPLEFHRAGGMQFDRAHPVELLKDQSLILWVDPDPRVLHSDLYIARRPPRFLRGHPAGR